MNVTPILCSSLLGKDGIDSSLLKNQSDKERGAVFDDSPV